MPFTCVQRRLTTWLASLALVLGALAPTLAQAVVASSDRSDWVQICSASGMVWIQLDLSSQAPDSPPATDMGMQCPWCQLHSPGAGLPPAPVPFAALGVLPKFPGDRMAAAPPPGVWTAAPARAPPLLS